MQQHYKKKVPLRQLDTENDYRVLIEHIIGLIGQEDDKVKVLEAALPCALAIAQTEVGALLVVDNNEKNMAIVTRQGMPDEIIGQLTKGDLGQLLLIGQWIRVEPKPLQLKPEQALLGRHELRYLLGIPLQFGRRVLGALVVGTRTASNNLFQEKRQEQLAILAQLVALILDNVRLRATNQQSASPEETNFQPATHPVAGEKTADELEDLLAAIMSAEEEVVNQNNDLGLLNALSSKIGSTLQLNKVLEIAIKQTRQTLRAEVGWCYLMAGEVLTLQEHQGLSEQYVAGMRHLKPGNGVEGMAYSRKEPIFRDGLLFHSGKARTLVKEEGLRTVAAVPLVNKENSFGVLALADRHDRIWAPRDKRMLISISQQIGQAIVNSQMFTEATEKAHNWEANYNQLQQANRQLASKVAALEQQIQALRQAEQQIFSILAISNKVRHRLPAHVADPKAEEQLVTTLKKALGKLRIVD